MKHLVLFLLFLPSISLAQSNVPENAANATPPKYTIVNGKKFFLLQNARHFTGNGLSPSALSVVNHPHSPAVTHNNARPTPSYNGEASPKDEQSKNNAILSVFPSSAR